MTNKFNKNVRNVLATGFLMATFTFGTGQAFANEEPTKTDEVEVVEENVIDSTTETPEVTETEGTAQEPTNDDEATTTEEETDVTETEDSTVEDPEGQTGEETTAPENEEESATEKPISVIDFFKKVIR